MPFETLFSCDSVEFSSSPTPPTASPETISRDSITDNDDHWSPAKISVQDIGSNDRWLMVELEGSATSEPKRSMIVEMKGTEPGAVTKTIQKLRFDGAQSEDYWNFLLQIASARMLEYFPQP
ncbi:hypothetical protein GSI_06071 [Ganoderma sinense ZZ0214-1]|uniref:Uncharacterized protein n=1 Tax=Ganoderma sinense ZZ0214-1 TaxID=1077348 RepID=A0A2G8SC96_9APHY|nr:hypothetical protein GSI_06071 [Ganoderma sinense ZZ0214-1]